jgi:hypothetical protein
MMDYELYDEDLDFIEEDDDFAEDYYEFAEDDEDFIEEDDDFAEDEGDFAERRRRRRRRRRARARPRRVRTAPGRRLYRSRPSKSYVTQAQLKSSLERVGAQIRQNAGAIKKVNGGLNTVRSTQARQGADIGRLKSDTAQLRKNNAKLRRELNDFRQMSLLMTMLSDSDSDDSMLPFLLLGGLGAPGTGNDNTLLMALALSDKL